MEMRNCWPSRAQIASMPGRAAISRASCQVRVSEETTPFPTGTPSASRR